MEAHMNTYAEVDNIPETACRILNLLWDKNRAMTVREMTDDVNGMYGTSWTTEEIRQFATLLVQKEYAERRTRRFHSYYIALGAGL
jgi:hypothetical protein